MKYASKLKKISLLSYRALAPWTEPISYISMKLIMPILQISFFALVAHFSLGRDAVKYVVIGNAVHLISYNALLGLTVMIVRDRSFGTLYLILATPIKKSFLILSRIMPHIIDGFLGSLLGLIYSFIFFKIDIANCNWLILLGSLLLISFSLCGLGLILSSLALFFKNPSAISNLLFQILLFVSGVNFPIDRLPKLLFYISKIIPLTYGVEMTRMIIDDKINSTFINNLYYITLLGVLYFIGGILVFKAMEDLSRKEGNIKNI